MTSTYDRLKSMVIEYGIHENNPDFMLKALSKLPLQQVKRDTFISLLVQLLEEVRDSENLNLVVPLVNKFGETYASELDISFEVSLLWEYRVPDDIIILIFSGFKHYTLQELLETLIPIALGTTSSGDKEEDRTLSLEQSTRRAILAFEKFESMSYMEYDFYYNKAVAAGNSQVALVLREQMENISPPAEINKFIGLHDLKEIPKMSQLKIKPMPEIRTEVPPIDDLVDQLIVKMDNAGITITDEVIEEAKDKLRQVINVSTQDELKEMLSEFIDLNQRDSLQDDKYLFRVLGPCNPDPTSVAEDLEFGGSRMFIDSSSDYNEDIGQIDDWFEGNCNYCLERIADRWNSVRVPKLNGGWEGCFCSWDCANDWHDNSNSYDDVTAKLLWIFARQCYEIGIYQRIDDFDYQDYIENGTSILYTEPTDQASVLSIPESIEFGSSIINTIPAEQYVLNKNERENKNEI